MLAATNPFATRYVAPGKVPWLGVEPQWLDELADQFHSLSRRAQVIGPHGTGKSTLLNHLEPKIAERLTEGGTIEKLTLRRGQPVIRELFARFAQLKRHDVLILDGFEQLSWWQRSRVRVQSNWQGCGLLITSHRPVGLPTLYTSHVSVALAREIVKNVWIKVTGDNTVPADIDDAKLRQLLTKHQGNMREVLMDLYDLVNASRPPGGTLPLSRLAKAR